MKSALIVLILATSVAAWANPPPSAPACEAPGAAGLEKLIGVAYDILEEEVSNCDQMPERVITDVIALTMFMLHYEPSGVGVEVIYPAYKKQQAQFDRALRKLERSDRKLFYETLKAFEYVQREGNG